MQNMIAQIVDMDQKAREMTAKAQQSKIDSEEEINRKREELRTEYLTRARQRLEANRMTERAAAEEAWEAIRQKHAEISNRLDAQYEEKGGEWVRSIVSRVLGA